MGKKVRDRHLAKWLCESCFTSWRSAVWFRHTSHRGELGQRSSANCDAVFQDQRANLVLEIMTRTVLQVSFCHQSHPQERNQTKMQVQMLQRSQLLWGQSSS